MAGRSTLEVILDSLKENDEKPKDLPPALPQRPTSRARLPSTLRGGRKGILPGAVGLGRDISERKEVKRPMEADEPSRTSELEAKPESIPVHENGNGVEHVDEKIESVVANGRASHELQEADSAYEASNIEPEEDDPSGLAAAEKSPLPAPSKLTDRSNARKRWREDGLMKNSRVWCRSAQGEWILGVVQSVEDEGPVVSVPNGQLLKLETLLPANPDILEGVDDLIQLSYLNEPAVLHNLKYRYSRGVIYTKAGPVLIAINPFKKIPIYSTEFVDKYRQGSRDGLDPHVYITADTAYREMTTGVNQSIIISGESGAGKTETAKIAMQYLAALGGGGGVENEILETNPILEAFGNAKTLRNNNSSRFGKLIDIFFDNSGKICGAKIQTYLLEKSRVVHQAPGERSYHIFYQLCAGADAGLRERLKLKHASDYHYLNQGGCLVIENVDDAQQFRRMLNAMDTVQIDKDDQLKAFEMLAAVLWLGNIAFSFSDIESHVTIVDREVAQVTASLLHCNAEDLTQALCTRKIHARNEDIVQELTLIQAVDARDALAKAIYASLFEWLVERINISMEVGKRRTGRTISILDIYGFESFKKNSFEQLCINYANERLQQHFNRHLFKLEQEEYAAECIDWTKVEFIDNQECLKLIEQKPLGLISLLDEECTFPKSTELSLTMKLNKHLSQNGCFKAERDAGFTIRHYAGEVTYDTSGIMEKNRDLLHTDILELLASCDSPLPRAFSAKGGAGVRKESQRQSVATKFKSQLIRLLQRLESTSPHFIRCVKPNVYQVPDTFDDGLVLQQLRCCGVLEVVRITRSGYPSRHLHQHFAERFGFMLQKKASGDADPLTICISILQQFNISPEMYQVGLTKLFFRAGQIAMLEDKRERTLTGVVGVQKLFRGYRARLSYKRMRAAAIYWQSLFRGMRARNAFKILKRRHCAAITIQKHSRRVLAKKEYQRLLQKRDAARLIQRNFRGFTARVQYKQLKRRHGAAVILQARMRGVQARRCFMEYKLRNRAAITIQKTFRGMVARKASRLTWNKVILIQSATRRWLAMKSFKQRRQELAVSQVQPVLTSLEPAAAAESRLDVVHVKNDMAAELLEWKQRALAAEQALRDREAEKVLMAQTLQQYQAKWSESEARMNSMEEVWQKQMASLQQSLAAAKKSLTSDDPFAFPAKSDETVQNAPKQRNPWKYGVLQDDDLDWDESTSVGTKTPETTVVQQQQQPTQQHEQQPQRQQQQSSQQTSSDNIPREFDAGRSVVGQLVKEFEHRTQVFNDDADFLVEVKSGQVEANLSPEDELKKLKQRFDVWKKDFKGRLRETKVILQKLSHMDDGTTERKRKWWSKRSSQ